MPIARYGLDIRKRVNRRTSIGQALSNPLEKEDEMTLQPGTPITVGGRIVCPDRKKSGVITAYYKTGAAIGLARFEIAVPVPQLREMKMAFPDCYSPCHYSSNRCQHYVAIKLIIGDCEYDGRLCIPDSRVQDVGSSEPLPPGRQYREPWISASLEDKSGEDVKLAYALKLGGFTREAPVDLSVMHNRITVLRYSPQ